MIEDAYKFAHSAALHCYAMHLIDTVAVAVVAVAADDEDYDDQIDFDVALNHFDAVFHGSNLSSASAVVHNDCSR